VTPDPLDVLKYAYVLTNLLTEGWDQADELREQLDVLVAPFVGDAPVAFLTYSDGSPVSVVSEYAIGRAFQTFRLPPGFPVKENVR